MMRRARFIVLVIIASAALAITGRALAQDEQPAPDRPRGREIMDRARRGEALTPDEQALRERMMARRAERLRAERDGGEFLIQNERLNDVDRAHYRIAEIHTRKQRYEQAVEELVKVVENSPDPFAVSLSHLNIATFYRRHLGDPDRAIIEYARVTGELRDRAQTEMVGTHAELGEFDKAAALLEQFIEQTDDPARKIELLNNVADLYLQAEQEDKAIAALQRIIDTLSYEQAQELREAREGPGDGPPEAMRRDGPPDAMRQQLLERIRDLEAAGRPEEAERLEQRLRGRPAPAPHEAGH